MRFNRENDNAPQIKPTSTEIFFAQSKLQRQIKRKSRPSYAFALGAVIPNSRITICRSFQASPFCRGSRNKNAG